MNKIQVQGVHHITMIGADRQTSIDFWEGVLGMPFVFEQPNLDVPAESHLYFDPGDGRLITVFTNENRTPDPTRNPEGIGNLHHLAFTVDDMDKVLEDYESKGYVNSMGGTWGERDKPGSGRYEYINLEDAGGMTMELLWNFKIKDQ